MERGRGRASLGPRGSFKGLQMWVELETHLGLLMSQPQLLHICLPPLATSDPRGPRGTCLLFSGSWGGFSPLARSAETTICVTALRQGTAAETQERGGRLLVSSQRIFS